MTTFILGILGPKQSLETLAPSQL